jgi:hypothetical protein
MKRILENWFLTGLPVFLTILMGCLILGETEALCQSPISAPSKINAATPSAKHIIAAPEIKASNITAPKIQVQGIQAPQMKNTQSQKKGWTHGQGFTPKALPGKKKKIHHPIHGKPLKSKAITPYTGGVVEWETTFFVPEFQKKDFYWLPFGQ